MRQVHPLRLQYEAFSNANPMMAPIAALAEQVRSNENRWPPTIRSSQCRRMFPRQIVAALDAWRDASEAFAERTFMAVYGSPTLQAGVGVDPGRHVAVTPGRQERAASRTHGAADC